MAKCSLGCKGGITRDEGGCKVWNGAKPAGTDGAEEGRQGGTAETAMYICDEGSICNVADGEESRVKRNGVGCDESRTENKVCGVVC